MSNSILSNEGVAPLHHCQMPSLQEHSATWGEMDPRAEWPLPREIFTSLLKIFICNSRIRRQHVERLHESFLRHMLHLSSLHLVYGWCELLFQEAFTSDIGWWASCLLDTKVNL